ncbi:MAG: TIGR03546 family protein [bacterium]
MLIIKLIKKFVKLLNSDASPNQMASGFALGSIIGLTPFFSLHNIGIWILVFLLKVNVASAFLGVAVFSLAGFFLDPLADKIGYMVLSQSQALHGLWTAMYNMPIIPFTRFNNTLVMGSFIISIVLFVPIVLCMKYFVVYYRKHLQARLQKLRVFQLLKTSKLYQWYVKFIG